MKKTHSNLYFPLSYAWAAVAGLVLGTVFCLFFIYAFSVPAGAVTADPKSSRIDWLTLGHEPVREAPRARDDRPDIWIRKDIRVIRPDPARRHRGPKECPSGVKVMRYGYWGC